MALRPPSINYPFLSSFARGGYELTQVSVRLTFFRESFSCTVIHKGVELDYSFSFVSLFLSQLLEPSAGLNPHNTYLHTGSTHGSHKLLLFVASTTLNIHWRP